MPTCLEAFGRRVQARPQHGPRCSTAGTRTSPTRRSCRSSSSPRWAATSAAATASRASGSPTSAACTTSPARDQPARPRRARRQVQQSEAARHGGETPIERVAKEGGTGRPGRSRTDVRTLTSSAQREPCEETLDNPLVASDDRRSDPIDRNPSRLRPRSSLRASRTPPAPRAAETRSTRSSETCESLTRG